MKSVTCVAFLSLLVAIPRLAFGQDMGHHLFNECRQFSFSVYINDTEGASTLTEERISRYVETRLRSARIYDDGGLPLLSIFLWANSVNERTIKFRDDIRFNKFVTDEFGNTITAIVWSIEGLGQTPVSQDPERFMLQSISELLDEFILEYLRTNEDYCD